jgi:hypothetical protein
VAGIIGIPGRLQSVQAAGFVGIRKIAVRFGVDPSTVQRISHPFDGAASPA